MAISVQVPKDLSGIKTKVALNLTKRQIICFSGAAVAGIPLYFLTKGLIGTSAAYMVNGRAQLERIMEARQLQKHMDIENDKVSYYVIADLSTWAENSSERSKLERFDNISEAMEAFQAYRGKDAQYSDDKARTTFGVSVHGIEFDVIHVKNNENVLSLDFTHSSEAKESKHFMDDLQTLSDSIGIDKVRVHRDMTPEEVRDFVKKRFEHQLKQGGLYDISLYMRRFDTLYEQGKMEKLMPTVNQKHIEEDVPITEWDNPYFEVKEPEQMAFSIKDKFVNIQTCTEGYDYSVFDADYKLIDGGVYENPDISIHAALKDVLEDFGLSEQDKRIQYCLPSFSDFRKAHNLPHPRQDQRQTMLTRMNRMLLHGTYLLQIPDDPYLSDLH